MDRTINLQKYLLAFGIPALLTGFMVLIVNMPLFGRYPEKLAKGITFDLLMTIPIIYFLLIRKTNIPKTSVIAILILGVTIGSSILPSENQQYLHLFKTWALPGVEIIVLFLTLYNLKKGIKTYRQNRIQSSDAFSKIKAVCNALLPRKIAGFLAFETAAVYYGFIHWKKVELKKNEFFYHKNSATISTLGAFIFIIGIETVVFHILLEKWNSVVAWIFTFLSIYTVIQLFGFLKSMTKRPITINKGRLSLNYGIMNQSVIDIEQISSIEIISKEVEYKKEIRKFSFLDSPNIIIKLNKKNTLDGLYGIKREFTGIAVYVDNPQELKDALQQCIIAITASR